MDRYPLQDTMLMDHRHVELHYLKNDFHEHSIHVHPFYEILFFLEGAVEEYVIGGNSYQLRPGDLLLLPTGIPYYPVFREERKDYLRYALWLSNDHLKDLALMDPEVVTVLQTCAQQEIYQIRCATPASRQILGNYLRMMWQETQNNLCCKTAHLYGLSINFLVHLNRIVANEHLLKTKFQQSDALLDQVTDYIREHYRENISLHDVAEHFFISASNIESLLAKGIGMPFYRYVTECRMIHSQELIASGMPLKAVGLACGYNDYSNFYRAFIQETGISPSQYRKNNPIDYLQSRHIEATAQEGTHV